MGATFEELIAEAAAVPLAGWDFSWFDGRATEERPPWGYARLLADRMAAATAALDIQSGGGEVTATVPHPPALLVVTDSWRPNIAVAARNLPHAHVVEVADRPTLPFRDGAFDLVVSRHPVAVLWDEIARVLRPGGRFLAQLIGPGTNRELSEAMLGPLPPVRTLFPDLEAKIAGLEVERVRSARLRAEYFDVGAVAHFLRKVVWTVPDFDVERFRPQLRAVHDHIQAHGPFVSYAKRLLIEAYKPVWVG